MALPFTGLLESENSECEFGQDEIMKTFDASSDGYEFMDGKFDGTDFLQDTPKEIQELSDVLNGRGELCTTYDSHSVTTPNITQGDTLEVCEIPRNPNVPKFASESQNIEELGSSEICSADDLLYEFLDVEGFPLEGDCHYKPSNDKETSVAVGEADGVLVEYLEEEKEDEAPKLDSGVVPSEDNLFGASDLNEHLNNLLLNLNGTSVSQPTGTEYEQSSIVQPTLMIVQLPQMEENIEKMPLHVSAVEGAENFSMGNDNMLNLMCSFSGLGEEISENESTEQKLPSKSTELVQLKKPLGRKVMSPVVPCDKTVSVVIMKKKSVNSEKSVIENKDDNFLLPRGIMARNELTTSRKIPLQVIKKTYNCELCSELFLFHGDYLKHKENIHFPSQRPYTCPICSKSFKQHPYFKAHLRAHVDNKKKNVCQHCGKSFFSPTALKTHIRIHTGEKPYHCNTCKKSFNQLSVLRAHEKIHDPNRVLENKPPSSEFSCPICSKSFNRKALLTMHMRYHSGEKRYSCQYCDKKFIIKSNKDQHERVHSKVRPFACKVCGKTFTQAASRNKHAKIHKPPEPTPLQDEPFPYEYQGDDMEQQVKVALESIEVSPVVDFDVSEFWTPQD